MNQKRKEGFLTALATAFKKDATTSIRKHSNEVKVHKKTMWIAIQTDLKLKSFGRTLLDFLSTKIKEKKAHKVQKKGNFVSRNCFSILAFKFMASIKP